MTTKLTVTFTLDELSATITALKSYLIQAKKERDTENIRIVESALQAARDFTTTK